MIAFARTPCKRKQDDIVEVVSLPNPEGCQNRRNALAHERVSDRAYNRKEHLIAKPVGLATLQYFEARQA